MKKQHLHHPLLFVVCFLLAVAPIHAQISKDFGSRVDYTQWATSGAEGALTELWLKGLGKYGDPRVKEKIQGTPFYKEDFSRGSVFYKDSVMGEFYLRYNAYNDEIQLKKTTLNEEPLSALAKNREIHGNVDGRDLVFTVFETTTKEVRYGYLFRIITGPRYQLFERYVKLFKEGKKSSNSLARSIPPKFVEQTDFYIGIAGEDTKFLLSQNKKHFLEAFPESDQPLIKKYIKENSLKISDKDDLIKLFSYLNSQ